MISTATLAKMEQRVKEAKEASTQDDNALFLTIARQDMPALLRS